MSHIPDMQELGHGTIAIGWLHPDHRFPQSDPAPEFLVKLQQYVGRARASSKELNFGAAGGFHTCEFCGRANGSANLGVPVADKIFYVPEMIAHYVEVHRYAPPPEFIAAVMVSPLPGTQEYVNAVAPYLKRLRALKMIDEVSLSLERHVTIVLFEYLTGFSESAPFNAEGRAEKVAIWTLLANLESILVEPFDPNYPELLDRARRLTRNYGKDDP